jgi:LysM repeat protein
VIRIAAPILLLACAATAAGAQVDPPPRDTVVIVPDSAEAAPSDTLVQGDTAARRPSRWGSPFAVESRGTPVPRRVRGEVVWVHPDSLRRDPPDRVTPDSVVVDSTAGVAVSDTVGADTAPAPPPRRTAARDSAARRRPARDTAAAPPRRIAAADSTRRPRADSVTAPRPGGRPRTHTVAAGETLFGIARRYNVTTAQLRVLNPSIDPQDLEVGAVLRLPATARPPTGAPPARPTAPAARRTHTVARGETLYGIARRYGVSVDAVMQANRMQEDQVRVGQTLVIPAAPRPN